MMAMKPFSKPTKEELGDIDRVAGAINALSKKKIEPAQEVNGSVFEIDHVYEIPLNLIKANPLNARRIFSQSRLDELALSIQKNQDTPASAYINEYGYVCLIDGHRRLEACRIAGKETLRVHIKKAPVDNKELYLESRRANTDRENQTPLDDAIAWKMLIDDGVFDKQMDIAAALGIDETVFSRTLNLSVLPKTVTRILADRPELHTLRMLDAIRKYWEIAKDEKTEQLILEIDQNQLSSRDVDARRNSLNKEKKTRNRGISVPMKYEHGESHLKRFDEKGALVLEISAIKDKKLIDILSSKINEVVKEILSPGS